MNLNWTVGVHELFLVDDCLRQKQSCRKKCLNHFFKSSSWHSSSALKPTQTESTSDSITRPPSSAQWLDQHCTEAEERWWLSVPARVAVRWRRLWGGCLLLWGHFIVNYVVIAHQTIVDCVVPISHAAIYTLTTLTLDKTNRGYVTTWVTFKKY